MHDRQARSPSPIESTMSVKRTVASTRSGSSSQPPDSQVSVRKRSMLPRPSRAWLPVAKRDVPGSFDNLRAGDLLRHELGQLMRNCRLADAAADLGRDADRRQHVAHVDLLVHQRKRFDRPWVLAPAEVVDVPVDICLVIDCRQLANHFACALAWPEERELLFRLSAEVLLGQAPGIVGRPKGPWAARSRDERRRALRIGRGEEHAHRPPSHSHRGPRAASRRHPSRRVRRPSASPAWARR